MKVFGKQMLFTALFFLIVGYPLAGYSQQDHSGHGDGNGQSMQGGGSGGGGMMRNRGNGGQGGDGDNHGGGMMRRGMQRMGNMMASDEGPATTGQSAFAVIREVVSTLQADPDTDWSQINIEALRRHLIDMDRVTLYAEAEASEIEGGARFRVRGDDERTIAAIQRMIPTHALQVERELSWDTSTSVTEDGVDLTVQSSDPSQTAMIRGLGFMGFMVQGEHHADHHLMMAGGSPDSGSGMMDRMMNHMDDHDGAESDAMSDQDHGSADANGHSGHH